MEKCVLYRIVAMVGSLLEPAQRNIAHAVRTALAAGVIATLRSRSTLSAFDCAKLDPQLRDPCACWKLNDARR